MYLQKNKKGFTLIELMVVVAIIGILALLGLRLYTGQQEKAKEAIVKANAGTVQTLIQAELADGDLSDAGNAISTIGGPDAAGMQNPFDPSGDVISETAAKGIVVVSESGGDGTYFLIQGYGKDGSTKAGDQLTAQR